MARRLNQRSLRNSTRHSPQSPPSDRGRGAEGQQKTPLQWGGGLAVQKDRDVLRSSPVDRPGAGLLCQ